MTIHYCYTDSPVGRLLLVGNYDGLLLLNFQDGPEPVLPDSWWRKDAAFFFNPIVQLQEYFAGTRRRFSLRLNPQVSDFQEQVLNIVERIPYGETASYRDIAKMLESPKAVRAIGTANRKNPLPLFIPCHRVVASNGRQTAFSGGLDAKEYLLSLEEESICSQAKRPNCKNLKSVDNQHSDEMLLAVD